jgi:hypothetical protein
MMLTKSVCKQCRFMRQVWFEEHWEIDGLVFCNDKDSLTAPFSYAFDTSKPPPKYCPYALEHIVNTPGTKQC